MEALQVWVARIAGVAAMVAACLSYLALLAERSRAGR